MSEMKVPTYEEFKVAVKKHFSHYWQGKEAEEYIEGEQATNLIIGRYSENVNKLNKGEITYDIFMDGCVASAGYCLSLMF